LSAAHSNYPASLAGWVTVCTVVRPLVAYLEQLCTTSKGGKFLVQERARDDQLMDRRRTLFQPVQAGVTVEHFQATGLEIPQATVHQEGFICDPADDLQPEEFTHRGFFRDALSSIILA